LKPRRGVFLIDASVRRFLEQRLAGLECRIARRARLPRG
jgi:hypothetical protein